MAAICRAPRSCLFLAAAELEADAMDCFDHAVAALRRELCADVADVAVDGAVGDLDVELIGRAHQLLAVEHRGWPGQERAQDAELDRGQFQRCAGEGRYMLLGIDQEAALRQRGSAGLGIASAGAEPAQDDIDPRHQLAWAERFCHVIVATDLEAKNAVDLLVARRQEQDRYVRVFAHLAADIEAVELRHADVEHDQVRPVGGKAAERLLAVARLDHVHAGFLQGDADDLADVAFVVDDENDAPRISPLTLPADCWTGFWPASPAAVAAASFESARRARSCPGAELLLADRGIQQHESASSSRLLAKPAARAGRGSGYQSACLCPRLL